MLRWSAMSLASPASVPATVEEAGAEVEGERRILCVEEPVMGKRVHTKLESVSWLRSDGIFCVINVIREQVSQMRETRREKEEVMERADDGGWCVRPAERAADRWP